MRFRLLPLLCALAASAGCIEAERLITVNTDGSGTIVDSVRPIGQGAALLAMGQDDKAVEKRRATAVPRFKAAATAMGVRFESFEPLRAGTPEVIRYTFSDISRVKADVLPFLGNENEEPLSVTPLSFRFRRLGGTSVVTVLTPPEKPNAAAKKRTPAEIDKEVAEAKEMMGMLKGMRIVSRLQLAAAIVKSNAALVQDRTVTLLELDMGAVLADEKSLRQLVTLDDPTKADPRILAGVKGLKINSLPELTVEFAGR